MQKAHEHKGSLSESVKGNKEMRLGFKTDHAAHKGAEAEVLMVRVTEFQASPLESSSNDNCHPPFPFS